MEEAEEVSMEIQAEEDLVEDVEDPQIKSATSSTNLQVAQRETAAILCTSNIQQTLAAINNSQMNHKWELSLIKPQELGGNQHFHKHLKR